MHTLIQQTFPNNLTYTFVISDFAGGFCQYSFANKYQSCNNPQLLAFDCNLQGQLNLQRCFGNIHKSREQRITFAYQKLNVILSIEQLNKKSDELPYIWGELITTASTSLSKPYQFCILLGCLLCLTEFYYTLGSGIALCIHIPFLKHY